MAKAYWLQQIWKFMAVFVEGTFIGGFKTTIVITQLAFIYIMVGLYFTFECNGFFANVDKSFHQQLFLKNQLS